MGHGSLATDKFNVRVDNNFFENVSSGKLYSYDDYQMRELTRRLNECFINIVLVYKRLRKLFRKDEGNPPQVKSTERALGRTVGFELSLQSRR